MDVGRRAEGRKSICREKREGTKGEERGEGSFGEDRELEGKKGDRKCPW